jgi:hypothetical protein
MIGNPGPSRAGTGLAVGTSLPVFLVLLAFLPPTVYWLDAPEFVAAAAQLGQPHPPGHPVVTLLVKAFLLVPAGPADFRANLFSAVLGAVAAGLTALLASDMAEQAGAGRRVAIAAGLAAGLGFGLCRSAAIQSLSVEVYTLNAALVIGAFVLALRLPGDARAGGAVALLLALGLANHHFLTVLAMPAVAVAYLRRATAWKSLAIGGAIAAIAVTGCYGLLVARSLAGAWPAWADAGSLSGLLWVASARVFAGSLGGHEVEAGGVVGNAFKAAVLVTDDLSPLGVALAAGGLVALALGRRHRALAAIALLVGGSLASKVAMGILDPDNPDDHGYFLVAVAGTAALAAACGGAVVAAAIRRTGLGRGALAGLGIAGLAGVAAVPPIPGLDLAAERSAFSDTVVLSRFLADRMPTGTVLMVSHFPVFFLAEHDALVDGVRPDVSVVQQGFVGRARGGRDYAAHVALAEPGLAPLANAYLATGELSWPEVRLLSYRRPVRFEASPDLHAPMSDVRYAGWTFAVFSPDGGIRPAPDQDVASFLDALRRVVPGWPEVELETRRVLMRNLASSADWLARSGWRDAARSMVDAALELNPVDRTLKAMRDRLEAASLAPPAGGS